MSGAVFCFLLILNGCQEKQETSANEQTVRPVKLLRVVGVSSDKTLKMPGTVRASDRVDLAFQVSGPLIQLPVEESGKPAPKPILFPMRSSGKWINAPTGASCINPGRRSCPMKIKNPFGVSPTGKIFAA